MEKNSLNYKFPIELTSKILGLFVASNILKNNTFGGPTHFYRRWATCLGSRDNLPNWQTPAGQVAGKKGGPRLCTSTVCSGKRGGYLLSLSTVSTSGFTAIKVFIN